MNTKKKDKQYKKLVAYVNFVLYLQTILSKKVSSPLKPRHLASAIGDKANLR